MDNEIRAKLGALLKAERENRQVDRAELADQLNVTDSNLAAIEDGDIASLPSELYFGLFAKSYAEAMGIDYTRTVEALKLELAEKPAEAETEENKTGKPGQGESAEESDTSGLIKKLLYLGAGIIGIFIIFIAVNFFFFNNELTSPSDGTDNGQAGVQTESGERELNSAAASYDWSKTTYTPPSKITLQMVPKAESWSTVLADGDTVIYRTLRVGRTYTAEANYRLLVSVGVPSAVDITLNGQPVNLRDKDSRRISRVEINQVNISELLTTKDKTGEPTTSATGGTETNDNSSSDDGN